MKEFRRLILLAIGFQLLAITNMSAQDSDSIKSELPSLYKNIYGTWVLEEKIDFESGKKIALSSVNPKFLTYGKDNNGNFKVISTGSSTLVSTSRIANQDGFFNAVVDYGACEFVSIDNNTLVIKCKETKTGKLYKLVWQKRPE